MYDTSYLIYNVAGVICVASTDTTKAVRDITKSLKITLVEMAHGDHLVEPSTGPLHFVLPHFQYTYIQVSSHGYSVLGASIRLIQPF